MTNRPVWVSKVLVAAACAAVLAGCDGGGVDLNVATTDNSVNNSVTNNTNDSGSSNPCASYTPTGSTTARRGTFDGTNCTYPSTFVSDTNPLTQNLTIPFISGVHIFQDALFVGTNVSSGVAPASGTGPRLTIEAGARLAFSNAEDYILINRGSQIIANGSPTAPIILSGFTDLVTNTAGAEDVQLWGGLVLNGNGITNNCSDAERTNNACHVVSEGRPSNYGGNNNADNSGVLRYVIVKHAGFEVATDDELNGITFNAVGSGTTVENVQVYSAYDDGMEFFGGAVNVTNPILMYVKDDSLDFSDGYVGTITNALVIQSANDSNHCIELDNIGSGRSGAGVPTDLAPVTAPVVNRMTCILSNKDAGTHGNSEGVRVRLGGRLTLQNSIIYSGYANRRLTNGTSNQCFRFFDTTSFRDAQDGLSQMDNTLIGCETPAPGSFPNGDTFLSWVQGANPSAGGRNYSFNTTNVTETDPGNATTTFLTSGTFFTATTLRNAAGATITPAAPVGAVRAADDWTNPWAYGIRAGNRRQPLWFE